MIDRCEVTDITHKYNLVYVAARNPDNTAQRVSISMTQHSFETMTDRQLTSMLIQALNARYPTIIYGGGDISILEMEDIEDIRKAHLNNLMLNISAIFMATVTSGDAPLEVIFIDKSNGVPTSWLWDFGDDTTSIERNPTHTYSTAGIYTVSLTVSRGGTFNTKTISDMITVT